MTQTQEKKLDNNNKKRPTYDQILKLQEKDFNISMTNMFKKLIKRGRILPKQWNLQKKSNGNYKLKKQTEQA